jgi:hypothetical protein
MRNLLFSLTLFLLTLLTLTAAAQDCKIERKYDEFKDQTVWTATLTMTGLKGRMIINRVRAKNEEGSALVIALIMPRRGSSESGVFVKFADGSIVGDEEQQIDIRYTASNLYTWAGYITLDADNKERFLQQDIVKLALGREHRDVPDKFAAQVRAAVSCLYAAE